LLSQSPVILYYQSINCKCFLHFFCFSYNKLNFLCFVLIYLSQSQGFTMTVHNMKLEQKPYFDLVQNGSKTIELRLWDEKRRQIKPGDEIIFRDGERVLTVTVTGLIVAETFADLLKIIDVTKTGIPTADQALTVMNSVYDIDKQKQNAVVGIMIKLK